MIEAATFRRAQKDNKAWNLAILHHAANVFKVILGSSRKIADRGEQKAF
jgi:hypothetical protein